VPSTLISFDEGVTLSFSAGVHLSSVVFRGADFYPWLLFRARSGAAAGRTGSLSIEPTNLPGLRFGRNT